MDLELLRHRPLDDREEPPELDGPVSRVASPNDFAGGDVEGGDFSSTQSTTARSGGPL